MAPRYCCCCCPAQPCLRLTSSTPVCITSLSCLGGSQAAACLEEVVGRSLLGRYASGLLGGRLKHLEVFVEGFVELQDGRYVAAPLGKIWMGQGLKEGIAAGWGMRKQQGKGGGGMRGERGNAQASAGACGTCSSSLGPTRR